MFPVVVFPVVFVTPFVLLNVPFAVELTFVVLVPCGNPFSVGVAIVPVTPVVEFTFDGAIVGDVGNAALPGGVVGERFGGTPGPEFVFPTALPYPPMFEGTPGPLGVVPTPFALLGLFVPVLFAGLFVPVLFAGLFVPVLFAGLFVPVLFAGLFVPVLLGTPVGPPLFMPLFIFEGVPALFAAPL